MSDEALEVEKDKGIGAAPVFKSKVELVPEALPPEGRRARILIGWLDPAALAAAAGGRVSPEMEGRIQRVLAARATVAGRPDGVEHGDAVQPAPAELEGHINALRGAAAAEPYWQEGWEVRVVHLARVCAFQAGVATDEALVRTDVGADLCRAAEVALPIAAATPPVNVHFDPAQKTWTVISRKSMNLRLQPQPYYDTANGVLGFRFAVFPSFMQVAEYNGRLYLRDGYHRAYGFLAHGVRRVPVFWRRIERFEELGLMPGGLAHDSVFGPRPPFLSDFLDDAVSEDDVQPEKMRLLVLSAVELSPPA